MYILIKLIGLHLVNNVVIYDMEEKREDTYQQADEELWALVELKAKMEGRLILNSSNGFFFFFYLQSILSLIRLLTDGGIPLEAMQR